MSGHIHFKESRGFREARGRMADWEVALKNMEDAYPTPGPMVIMGTAKKATGTQDPQRRTKFRTKK